MERNATYIIFDGYVDVEKYRALYFIMLCSAFVVTICSNSTIVCLIWIHKNLHKPMYFFIAALLLNSIFYSTAFCPKILLDIMSERQVVSYSICLFQWFIFYALAGAEFLLLTVMAFDRYLAICKPLQYPTLMTKCRVKVLLAVAWTVPAIQVAVTVLVASRRKLCSFTFRGIVCNSTVYKLQCVQFTQLKIWGLIALVNLVFLPAIFNLFTYIRIFIITNRRGLEVRRKAMRTCLPHLVVFFNYLFLSTFDVLLARFDGEFPKIGRFILSLQLLLFHPILNPFIYGLKMEKISAHLRKTFSADVSHMIQD